MAKILELESVAQVTSPGTHFQTVRLSLRLKALRRPKGRGNKPCAARLTLGKHLNKSGGLIYLVVFRNKREPADGQVGPDALIRQRLKARIPLLFHGDISVRVIAFHRDDKGKLFVADL